MAGILANHHDFVEAIFINSITPSDCHAVGLPVEDALWDLFGAGYDYA